MKLTIRRLTALVALTAPAVLLASPARARAELVKQVIVPDEDRFEPFVISIHEGDTIEWINQDTDDHTVVSDDAFTTSDNAGTNHKLLGTDSNNGQPSTFSLTFNHRGRFVYFCRFHAHLDGSSQPVAPGPRGGIQDDAGNFGTPMTGVVVVKKP